MRAIGKQQEGYFGISEVQFNLGYITVQRELLCWLVPLILIGLATLMIESLLQVMFLVLVPNPSLGLVRSNRIFLFLQQM
jgi:hypothetical protein